MSAPVQFYAYEPNGPSQDSRELAPNYEIRWWQPALTSTRPPGFRLKPFGVWWAFHHLRVFANRNYALVGIYDGDRLVHRTCVFPGYFRFPFMQRDDLQIGDVWTDRSARGKGLAGAALAEVISRLQRRGSNQHGSTQQNRRLWYLVEDDNVASIRLAESAGFQLVGQGVRAPRFGISALAAYRITQQVATSQARAA